MKLLELFEHLNEAKVIRTPTFNIWKNPTRTDVISLLDRYHVLRGSIDTEGNTYVWNARNGIHYMVRDRYLRDYDFANDIFLFDEKGKEQAINSAWIDYDKDMNGFYLSVFPNASGEDKMKVQLHEAKVFKFPNDLTVWQNPTRNEIIELLKRFHAMRGLVDDKGNVYVWNAFDAVHDNVLSYVPNESNYLFIYDEQGKSIAKEESWLDEDVFILDYNGFHISYYNNPVYSTDMKVNLQENVNTLKQSLQMMVNVRKQMPLNDQFKYCCIEDFVLQHGREWKAQPLPQGIPKGPQKECFRNAILLAWDRGYTYAEGYILFHIPILHAWCIDEDGMVIDNTLDSPETHPYFGVAFDTDWASKETLKRGKAGLLDDYDRRFPILTGKIKPKFA